MFFFFFSPKVKKIQHGTDFNDENSNSNVIKLRIKKSRPNLLWQHIYKAGFV